MDDKQRDFENRIHYGNLESNLRFLSETGVLNKQKTILEIGSGYGGMLSFLYNTGYNIRGVDINKDYIEESKYIYGDLPFSLINSENLPFENKSFDIVISFDVFEHIPDSDNHLREVYRVLNNGGYYLLQTPNEYTNVIFETIRYKSFTKWKEKHCSLHSYLGAIDRFSKHGFQVEFYDIPVVGEFFKRKIKRYLGSFGLFLIKIINPDKFPMILKTNFYIQARKMS